MAGRHAEDVIGRNFFEVPCTKVKEFHGRFQEFMAAVRNLKIFFTFRFDEGNARVQIIFARRRGL
jgi:photoactive yellow protein